MIAGSAPRGQLVLVRPNGRLVASVAAADLRHDRPMWGAGARVAFVHAGHCGIDVAHSDGTHVHRLTRVC